LLIRVGVRLDQRLSPLLQDRLLSRAASRLPPGVAGQTMRDVDTLRQALSGPAALAIMDLPWAPIFIGVAFLLHPYLGLFAVVGAGVLLLLSWLNQRATRQKAEAALQANSAAYATTDATMSNAEAVRALGMRRALVARQTIERNEGLGLFVDSQFATAGYTTATRFTRLLLQSLALGCGALLVIDNKLSGGSVFAVSLLIARGLQPIEQIIGSWSAFQAAKTAYANMMRVLRVTGAEGTVPAMIRPAPAGAVRLENISVRSPAGKVIVNNVSFEIRPGEILGIIGGSGAGKTTLTRVMSGAIAPDAGVMRLDGADFAHWDAEALGAHIGYLPQHSGLMAGTIRDNISRFGRWTDADQATIDDRVFTATKQAGLHDLIESLPDGYETVLGPRGQGLSAGQGQRAALARALYGEPIFLILDEPNSHLDGAGEAMLIEALLSAKARGAAIALVAHRAGVLDIADRLLVLQNGMVASYGTRDEVTKSLADQRRLQGAVQPAEAN
jgi:ATP-binding cassette subfamily C protein